MATRNEILALTIQVDNAEAKRRVEEFVSTVQGAKTKTEPALAGMGAGFGVLKSTLAGLGLSVTVAGFDQLLKRMQSIREASQGFEFLSKQAGFSADALERLSVAGGREITNLQLMEKANQAMQLGLVRSQGELEEMVSLSESLADVVGMDATRALELFTTGLARQSDRSLIQLGIQIDTIKVYQDYAKALNTTVDQLTEAERATAFQNAALEKARERAKAAGEELLTFSSIWQLSFTGMTNTTGEFLDEVNRIPDIIKRAFDTSSLTSFVAEWVLLWNNVDRITKGQGPLSGPDGFIGPTAAQAGFVPGSASPNIRPSEPDWLMKAIESMGPFQQFPNKLHGLSPDGGAPEFQGFGLDVMEKETTQRQQLEEQLLAMRMDYAEQWSTTAQGLEIERSNNEYDRLIEAQQRLGGDITDIVRQREENATAIEREYSTEREAIHENEARRRMQIQLQLAANSIRLAGALFKENKMAAIAETVINTYAGAVAAFKDTHGPYWIRAAAAASAIAAGMASVASMRNTSIGGGGGGGSFGGGGGGASSSASQTIGSSQASAVPMHITIALEGQGFIQSPDEFARMLSKLIEEQLGRAGTIQVVS